MDETLWSVQFQNTRSQRMEWHNTTNLIIYTPHELCVSSDANDDKYQNKRDDLWSFRGGLERHNSSKTNLYLCVRGVRLTSMRSCTPNSFSVLRLITSFLFCRSQWKILLHPTTNEFSPPLLNLPYIPHSFPVLTRATSVFRYLDEPT